MNDTLRTLGWNDFFQTHWDALDNREGLIAGRVLAEHRKDCEIATTEGVLRAEPTGRLRYTAETDDELPAVGDWVAARSHGDGRASIVGVLPRRTRLARQIAGRRTAIQIIGANLDVVFLVTSMNREMNFGRIERYLTTIWESGAQPVIILNKADLASDPASWCARAERVAPGVPIAAISALNGDGVPAIEGWLGEGKTVGLVGSSGVGKSTLVNRLLGKQAQVVQAIREDDDEGRHTTTSRHILPLPDGRGLLMDTPGMREMQLWGGEGLDQAFEDVEVLIEDCRFRDCTHVNEPGCAVLAAIDDGGLDPRRLSGFLKLQRERAYFEMRQDENAQRAQKREAKRFTKHIKKMIRTDRR